MARAHGMQSDAFREAPTSRFSPPRERVKPKRLGKCCSETISIAASTGGSQILLAYSAKKLLASFFVDRRRICFGLILCCEGFCSSPLARTKLTAEIIWDTREIPMVALFDLREIDLYSFQVNCSLTLNLICIIGPSRGVVAIAIALTILGTIRVCISKRGRILGELLTDLEMIFFSSLELIFLRNLGSIFLSSLELLVHYLWLY